MEEKHVAAARRGVRGAVKTGTGKEKKVERKGETVQFKLNAVIVNCHVCWETGRT